MKPAVLIVNWNSGDHLRNLIRSLAPFAPRLSKILVIDNDSGDGSCSDLSPLPNLMLERPGRNLGFAAACNSGISRLESDWILLLNPDVVIDPASLQRLFGHALTAVGCAIVLGPLRDIRNDHWQIDFQIRRLPTPWSFFRDALFLDELLPARSLKQEPSAPFEVEQPAAAYWLLYRRAWSALGGFDEQFHPAWFEDVDFCRRLHASGWKIRCFPDCPQRHAGGHSLAKLGRREFTRIYYRNMLRYIRKHHFLSLAFLWPAVRLGSRIRQVVWR